MIFADLSIQETETTLLNNENHICQNYDHFLDCCKLKFEEALRPKVRCTIPGKPGPFKTYFKEKFSYIQQGKVNMKTGNASKRNQFL